MQPIGFSTGDLYDFDVPIAEKVSFFIETGATAIELLLGPFESMVHFYMNELNEELITKITQFNFISIHAPDLNYAEAENSETEVVEAITMLFEIVRRFNLAGKRVNGIVVHPYKTENITTFSKFNLPFLIENMDKDKDGENFKHPASFQCWPYFLLNSLGCVLDVQHAYETIRDHKATNFLNRIKVFVDIMGTRLNHLHVSGQTSDSHHSLVRLSENREAIESVLAMRIPVPKILEGVFPEMSLDLACQELNLVRRFENC